MRRFFHPQTKLFASLLVLGVALSGYFSYKLAGDLWRYGTRNKTAQANIRRWEVKAAKERYAITAHYFFEAEGKGWEGASTLPKPWHLNEGAAIAFLKTETADRWMVWYNPRNPIDSSLDREFPLGFFLRTLTCYGVVLYALNRISRGAIRTL